MSYMDDPRVYFAAERTLLAWVRTGIAAIGLGFVVAKFGIFLQYFANQPLAAPEKTTQALAIGALLILVGSISCWLAAMQFKRFCSTLKESEIPARYLISIPFWFGQCFALIGLLLTVHLAW